MVYHQARALIGYSTSGLICDRPLVEKILCFLREKLKISYFLFFILPIIMFIHVYTKTIRPLGLVDYDLIAHSAEYGLMGYQIVVHSPSRSNL